MNRYSVSILTQNLVDRRKLGSGSIERREPHFPATVNNGFTNDFNVNEHYQRIVNR